MEEQSLRHTINSKPLIIGDEGAYQYIEALGRALTYSQHALTKHQINRQNIRTGIGAIWPL